VRLVAALLTVCGLAVLLVGTAKAVPFVFFGTAEERADVDDGRRLLLAATLVLLVASALVAARSGTGRALLVAAAGVAVTALAYGFPKTVLAWLALFVLGPAALIAAVTALADRG
jgi:branched-subunit amino acid transport protein AzlD